LRTWLGPEGADLDPIQGARTALDKEGAVIGHAVESKGFSRIDTNESGPSYSIAS
jgi:hypothetical protein